MILVGTDFSPISALAIAEASVLAAGLGLRIEVVHVVERYGNGWTPGDAERTWLNRHGLTPDRVRVRHGVPWIELIRCASELSPRLLVVGSHGVGGYQPLALGSTVNRLTLRSAQPVLVVTPRLL